jgi:Domain of unknown function (DUF4189)
MNDLKGFMMRSSIRCFAVPALVLASAIAQAQCRMGSGPDFGDGIPYCSQPPPTSYAVPSGPQWASRWGAIATGASPSGTVLGVASDMKNQQSAEKAAIKQCRSQGGKGTCAIEVSYRDQCAVMVWGNGYGHSARAETVARASDIAPTACDRKTSNCQVYYSNCSYPVRVR